VRGEHSILTGGESTGAGRVKIMEKSLHFEDSSAILGLDGRPGWTRMRGISLGCSWWSLKI